MNIIGITLIQTMACLCRNVLEQNQNPKSKSGQRILRGKVSLYSYHTGLNVALFPVLFFFSGLYYTDVVSTLVVLLAYYNHLKRISQDEPSHWSAATTILLGLLALLMRQTNVFWIIYMAGLEVVHAMKTIKVPGAKPRVFNSLRDVLEFYSWRYSMGDIHDPSIAGAYQDGKKSFPNLSCQPALT